MTPSPADRRVLRRGLVEALFPDSPDAALDELARLDTAWAATDGAPSPPTRVLDDVLLLSRGELDRLRSAARVAVLDPRDLYVAADEERHRLGHGRGASS